MMSLAIICEDVRFPLKTGSVGFAHFETIRFGRFGADGLPKDWALWRSKRKKLWWRLRTKDELGLCHSVFGEVGRSGAVCAHLITWKRHVSLVVFGICKVERRRWPVI